MAVGLLFSCSKESAEPQLKPSAQDAQETPVVKSVDPNTPGAIRLDLTAKILPFEATQGSFAAPEGQSLRGAEVSVGGPDLNKAVTYRITGDAKGEVPVRVIVYDVKGMLPLDAKAKVLDDGKGIDLSLGALMESPHAAGGILKRIVDGKSQNPKLALLIGHDEDGKNFTNKGAQLITYHAGQPVVLPDNFILLKATEVPLEYDKATNSLSIPRGNKVTLKMEGYIVGARFQNRFSPTVCLHNWVYGAQPFPVDPSGNPVSDPKRARIVPRPPLGIIFRVDNLSATYKADLAFDNGNGRFNIGQKWLNADESDPNIWVGANKRTPAPGFGRFIPQKDFATPADFGERERENFLDAVNLGEFYIPVTGKLDPKKFSEGEQFVLLYSPNPRDVGSIAYKSEMKLFYDDSPITKTLKNGEVYFEVLSYTFNSFRKEKTYTPENKFQFVTFDLAPKPNVTSGRGIWKKDAEKRYKAYQEAFVKYGWDKYFKK